MFRVSILFLLLNGLAPIQCKECWRLDRNTSFPVDWMKYKQEKYKCGGAFNLAARGFVPFHLKSKGDKECSLALIGSYIFECTATLYCAGGGAQFANKTNGKLTEYLRVMDGLYGEILGVGNFYFNGIGYYPQGQGSDLFLTFKGTANARFKCVGFCKKNKGGDHNIHAVELPDSPNYPPQTLRTEQGRCKCGFTHRNHYPYSFQNAVALMDGKRKERINFCTADIITDRHIITAASCFNKMKSSSKYYALIHSDMMDPEPGSWTPEQLDDRSLLGWNITKRTDADENSTRIYFKKSDIVFHPLFDKKSFSPTWDVAIIRISPPYFDFTGKHVKPVCLPSISEVTCDFMAGVSEIKWTTLGWGRAKYGSPKNREMPHYKKYPYVYGEGLLNEVDPLSRNRIHEDCGLKQTPEDYGFCLRWRVTGIEKGSPLHARSRYVNFKDLLMGIASKSVCEPGNTRPVFHAIEQSIAWIYYITQGDRARWCGRYGDLYEDKFELLL